MAHRSKVGIGLALLAAIVAPACSHHPFERYSIKAVELRQAPKLEFLRARAGMKFLEVRFEFENRSKETLTLRALDFSLRDFKGTLYPFSAQVLYIPDGGQPRGRPEADIEAGQTLPGSVVFQIPDLAAPAELIYRQDVEGGLVVKLASAG